MIILFPEYDVDETGMSIPRGGIKKDAIGFRAVLEATNYTPFNPYLNNKQKNICEICHNLPAASFVFSFLFFSWLSFEFLKPVVLAIYISLVFGWLVTVLDEKILAKFITLNFFYNKYYITLCILGIAFINGIITWKSGIGLVVVYYSGLFVPGTNLFNNISRSKHPRLNPRYGAAKELFKISFPFEKYLPDSPTMIADDIASARGSEIISWTLLFLLVFATAFFMA